MPFVALGYAPPSTLADVIGQTVDAFGDMGNATTIQVGKKYLEHGAGFGPRVVFVPEPRGKMGAPQELGGPASVTHSCTVHIRGPEDGDDINRFRVAYFIADIVVDCINTAGTGRITWGDYGDGSPVDVEAYGAEVVLSFTYTRDVRHHAARWALSPATDDTSGAVPLVPPGVPADDIEFTTTVAPKD